MEYSDKIQIGLETIIWDAQASLEILLGEAYREGFDDGNIEGYKLGAADK
jgi:hypothetical protein